MTDTTKTAKNNKMLTAIRLINENPTMPESEIGALIASTLNIKLGNAIHNYYKAPVRKGLCDIKTRVLDRGKKPRQRKIKSKEVPIKKLMAEVNIPSTIPVSVKAVPVEKPKFTPEEVNEFQQGLARARAKALNADQNGKVELPAFLRRTATAR